MRNAIALLTAVITVVGCKYEKPNYKETIIGTWELEGKHLRMGLSERIHHFLYSFDVPKLRILEGPWGENTLLSFSENGRLVRHQGIFNLTPTCIEDNQELFEYSGMNLSYHLKPDSILMEVVMYRDTFLSRYRIGFIAGDSMLLVRGDLHLKYRKKKPKMDSFDFDSISVRSYNTNYSYGVPQVTLSKDKKLVSDYNTCFKGTIQKEKQLTAEEYLEVMNNFTDANISKLGRVYGEVDTGTEVIRTDLEFFQNGVSVKKITDFGFKSPPKLLNAYQKLRYMHQLPD